MFTFGNLNPGAMNTDWGLRPHLVLVTRIVFKPLRAQCVMYRALRVVSAAAKRLFLCQRKLNVYNLSVGF